MRNSRGRGGGGRAVVAWVACWCVAVQRGSSLVLPQGTPGRGRWAASAEPASAPGHHDVFHVLFVRNVPSRTTAAELRTAVERVCAVADVSVPLDRTTGRGRGFAFVTLPLGADARALEPQLNRDLPEAVPGGAPRLRVKAQAANLKNGPEPTSATCTTSTSAVAVNARLVAASSPAEALRTYAAHAEACTDVNLATVLARLARFGRAFERSRTDPRVGTLVRAATDSIVASAHPHGGGFPWRARHLATVADALVRLRLDTPPALDAIAATALRRRFDPQALAKTARAFASAKHDAPPALFDHLAHEASRGGNLRAFNGAEVVMTAQAFAKQRDPVPALFDAVAHAAKPRLRQFSKKDRAQLALAFAAARHDAPDLLDAIADLDRPSSSSSSS